MTMPRSINARCLRRTPWRRPWTEDKRGGGSVGRTRWPAWVRNLKGLPGVYFIRDAGTKEVLYVGRGTSCVKKALVRHFAVWGSDSRAAAHHRQTFDRRLVEVKVYVLRERAWCAPTEAELIARLAPRMNRRPEARALREPGEDDEALTSMDGDDANGIPF